MSSNEYHFITNWELDASREEIAAILSEPLGLMRWWPSVYLNVRELERGDPETGIGREIELYTKGWLPYTLRWNFRVTENNLPEGMALEAIGDFEGTGRWTFRERPNGCAVEYDWRIRADKPLLKHLSFVFKPFFSANHHWAMDRGRESLVLEIQRRRARQAAQLDRYASIAPPPAPTFAWLL